MDVADLSTLDVVVRVVGGALLGAVVGIERESAGQEAGFRTHLLLAAGAALFSVASVGAFDSFITDSDTNVQIDVTRIASYVAAGIGFIGGGVIVKQHGSVRGIGLGGRGDRPERRSRVLGWRHLGHLGRRRRALRAQAGFAPDR